MDKVNERRMINKIIKIKLIGHPPEAQSIH